MSLGLLLAGPLCERPRGGIFTQLDWFQSDVFCQIKMRKHIVVYQSFDYHDATFGCTQAGQLVSGHRNSPTISAKIIKGPPAWPWQPNPWQSAKIKQSPCKTGHAGPLRLKNWLPFQACAELLQAGSCFCPLCCKVWCPYRQGQTNSTLLSTSA